MSKWVGLYPTSSEKAHLQPSTLHARPLNPPLLKHKNPVILIHNSTLFGLNYSLSLSILLVFELIPFTFSRQTISSQVHALPDNCPSMRDLFR